MTIANVFAPSTPAPLSRSTSSTLPSPSIRGVPNSGSNPASRSSSSTSSTRGTRTAAAIAGPGKDTADSRHSSSSSSLVRHSSLFSTASSTTCPNSDTAARSGTLSPFNAGSLEASCYAGGGGATMNVGDPQSERTMGLGSAILMIIGTLIGTGIFASPGPLFDSVHSTQTSFIIWAFAGMICTIGAYSYAELGTMFPSSGGDFNYLSRAYGRKMGLIFGWTFIMVLNPVGTSGIAGVLGRYVVDLIHYFYEGSIQGGSDGSRGGIGSGHDFYNMPSVGGGGWRVGINSINGTVADAGSGGYYWVGNDTVYGPLTYLNDTVGIDGEGHYVRLNPHSPYSPGSPLYNAPYAHPPGPGEMSTLIRLFSVGAILLMGAINVFFKEGGKYASNFLAILKLAGMMLLIIIGSMAAAKNHVHSEPFMIPIEDSSRNVLDYVSALCFAFFAYNGFNNINLGLGELQDPERNLKWAVCLAMPSVTVLFLLANFALFSILSSHDLRHIQSLTLHAGHKVLGTPGGYLMAGTVIASALGSINANIWAGTRLLVTLANDNELIPKCMSKTWKRTGTQAFAMLFLIVQASIHALIGLDFKQFSKVYSAVGWTWYGLSVLGLLYLRKKKPHFPRPVKIWYPLAVLFVAVAAFLVFGALLLAFGSRLLNPAITGDVNEEGKDGQKISRKTTPGDATAPDAGTGSGAPVEWGTVGMVIFVFIMVSCSWCAIRGTRWFNRHKHQQRANADGAEEENQHSPQRRVTCADGDGMLDTQSVLSSTLDKDKGEKRCHDSIFDSENVGLGRRSTSYDGTEHGSINTKAGSTRIFPLSNKPNTNDDDPIDEKSDPNISLASLNNDTNDDFQRTFGPTVSDIPTNLMDNYVSGPGRHQREHSQPQHQHTQSMSWIHTRTRSHHHHYHRRYDSISHQHNPSQPSVSPLHHTDSENHISHVTDIHEHIQVIPSIVNSTTIPIMPRNPCRMSGEVIAITSATDHTCRHRHSYYHRHHHEGLHHRHSSLDQHDTNSTSSSSSVVLHPWSPSAYQDSPASITMNAYHTAPSVETLDDPMTPLSPMITTLPHGSSIESNMTLVTDFEPDLADHARSLSNQEWHTTGDQSASSSPALSRTNL